MLGNSSCPRPLAVLADLDRAAKVPRYSRYSRLARALRERPRLARVSGRPRRASNASGLELLVDTNAPVTAQIQLWPTGDFATQSNNLRRVYARINPDDWDGDGLDWQGLAAKPNGAPQC